MSSHEFPRIPPNSPEFPLKPPEGRSPVKSKSTRFLKIFEISMETYGLVRFSAKTMILLEELSKHRFERFLNILS